MSKDIVRYFRNAHIPAYVRNKSQLIAYVLVKYRNSEPISNGEFVFDLRCTRFGGVIHNLRKDGWNIATLKGKEAGHSLYYLVSKPDDELNQDTTLKLI